MYDVLWGSYNEGADLSGRVIKVEEGGVDASTGWIKEVCLSGRGGALEKYKKGNARQREKHV